MNYLDYLPTDLDRATLLGRAEIPSGISSQVGGPSPVMVYGGQVYDLFPYAHTTSQLLNRCDFRKIIDYARQTHPVCAVEDIISNSVGARSTDQPLLLAPTDLQPIKACGVTFACSMIERVIEEQAGGNKAKAALIRTSITEIIGTDLSALQPGSVEAEQLKLVLIDQGVWSQYLEVGIGPYAEVFSKSQAMSAVGLGAEVGINSISEWNNPEPEIVLVVDSLGEILGVTLGNDVNLRDIEGRSALLLGKAKDNNASCALGPFIRLIDEHFTLEDVRNAKIALEVKGKDGFTLTDGSQMSEMSRDIEDLVSQTFGAHHQYPDGFALMTGTMFAPIADRGAQGSGFTHLLGDIVRISCPSLGCLENIVSTCDQVAPWTFGTGALFENIIARAGQAQKSAAVRHNV